MPQERLEALQRKHSMLSALIEREESLPAANESYVRQLKRQKLMIKDILSGIRDDLMDEARERQQTYGRA
ncbi:MAG: DUF465 domain-containing protein [Rhodospirillales bacterium]|nr:DUF465 domain-containing protein [Alphaproteobacteria bacterium]MCB9987656.1 DUF465 domain-containing protein [Rhodospirillales bacterium]USO08045.1 MAG: DUF465 domain-containing protein [Rhodospirillales bacterium]